MLITNVYRLKPLEINNKFFTKRFCCELLHISLCESKPLYQSRVGGFQQLHLFHVNLKKVLFNLKNVQFNLK